MTDQKILELFRSRDQRAIEEAEAKYGAFLKRIAMNLTGDERDAEECVSDALLSAWNSIPPAAPEKLGAYLGKLARNLALNVLQKQSAVKRGSGASEPALSELAEIASSIGDPEGEAECRELAGAIGSFVKGLGKEKRLIFTARYWQFESIETIARCTGRSKESVRSLLYRMRGELKKYLEERGYSI